MNAPEVLAELQLLGRESYRKVMAKHGVGEPLFGVKIEDLQKIRKRIKKDYQLALDLYETGNYDAMYLAGLIADDARMTKADLRRWVKKSARGALGSSTVAGVAAESAHGWELALEWIESPQDFVAAAGWATLSLLVAIKPDSELDLPALERLLERVQRTIHDAPDAARYQMNGYVISLGASVRPLSAGAVQAAEKIGTVNVDMGDTACQVPFAPDYIRKIEQRGTIGKKRKSAKC